MAARAPRQLCARCETLLEPSKCFFQTQWLLDALLSCMPCCLHGERLVFLPLLTWRRHHQTSLQGDRDCPLSRT